ncbi:type III-A CRISPR-associated RAMP protein Csm3 [Microbulbifer flavimaris]|uniref:CRISPR system Cms endoribonuclease Csm3 n=1 Tax=Microbulbifer flavimaris TaxID=1781068 RepID=A0ABX4HZL8_9GAMM|nr:MULTISPECIES: type III-A CRISPR-associated RAMP protein Csm3 [Microbulbifer]KUJ83444.1 type III-A CRISPR-associated RAMP protein Csm3 [Microbulbifer sp. ZGT114]PCO05600.1 type III-A CRISPR-associated RAMP protein Csm3 [Microbulbifer flavimaris]
MQLNHISRVTATIELHSGLHIGAGRDEIRIGGTDNPVVKHPYTDEPYIPGSSLKGKLRSLLEWRAGVATQNKGKPVSAEMLTRLSGSEREAAAQIARLFGLAGDSSNIELAEEIGPTRISFADAALQSQWLDERREEGQLLTEAKSENSINRISGVADNPRWTERVPAGARFDLVVNIRHLQEGDEALVDLLLTGLKLLEQDSLGGSGSRGYGKLRFEGLKINGESADARFEELDPFAG